MQYLHPIVLPEFHRQLIRSLLDVDPKRKWDPVAMGAVSSPESACEPDCWNSACTASPAPGQNVPLVLQASPSPRIRGNRMDQIGISSSLENEINMFKGWFPPLS
jgi:hypothetical protein